MKDGNRRRARALLSAKKRQVEAWEQLHAPEEAVRTFAKTGIPMTLVTIEEAHPYLTAREYADLLEMYRRITGPPRNRHERRAKSTWERLKLRRVEKNVARSLDWYERTIKLLSPSGSARYQAILKRGPHPDGHCAPSALDSAAIADARRAQWEVITLWFAERKQLRIKRAA